MIPDPTAPVGGSEPTVHGAVDVVDRSTLALVSEYARLSGGSIEPLNEHLVRLRTAPDDARFFAGRAEHLLALDVTGVELEPNAELPVIGGAFWTGLLAAIRSRGSRCVHGMLPITVATGEPAPDVAVADAEVEVKERLLQAHSVVRLAVKLSFAAGTTVEEELVESDALDLTTGQVVPEAVRAGLDAPPTDPAGPALPSAPRTSLDRLAPALLRALEEKVAERVDELQERANRELATELSRIDRYYTSLGAEVRREDGAGSAALKTIEHEHEKRRSEEMARHRVRVDVHPVQALERGVATERVTWTLRSPHGRTAEIGAQRYLTGDGGWGLLCDACGEAPKELAVCHEGHAVGTECASRCAVCHQRFCADHGHPACAVDGAPVCDEHAERCHACRRVYCVDHEAACAENGHRVCVDCIVSCAVCSRGVCTDHSVTTGDDAPRGSRVLCKQCVTYCEGATSEPIGLDEAAVCGSCANHICERHQVRCVVDHEPHCSKHLRRSDRSRRFVCESHVAACEFEPDLMFAEDEIGPCVECGKRSCNRHGAPCHGDERWHCTEHLVALTDVVGIMACEAHRSTCHVDGRLFSLAGTSPCEICSGLTCRGHTKRCDWCGASVCAKDTVDGRCVTCTRLAPSDDPPDEVMAAAAALTGDRRVRTWHVARDGGRFVVQLDFGWTRRTVFSVPHGSSTAVRVRRHSLFGTVGA